MSYRTCLFFVPTVAKFALIIAHFTAALLRKSAEYSILGTVFISQYLSKKERILS